MTSTKMFSESKLDIKPSRLLQTILEEIRLMRSELALLLPQEDLKEYTHPERIKRSYQKAIKQYPPVSA